MSEEIKKQYLNIWEQVEKNKEDILSLVRGAKTLADFGIKVIGYVASEGDLPDPADYLQDGGEYGDAFAVGSETPYDYYVFTRPFEDEEDPQWFNIGEFPKAGPQGEAGQDGEQGERGERGLTGPAGPIGRTGNTGPVGPAGPAPTIGENGNWYRDGVDTGLPSRGPQGEQGEPGSFFHVRGQVASADLLPAAADVDIESAYMVGASAPYDVYCIMDVSGTHYWLNLGRDAVIQSDTKVGSLTFSATGTLSAEILNAISNTSTEDFLKIGDRYFVKQSTGNYYAMKRDSGEVLVYCMSINMSTGEWVITTETMCDLDSPQTFTGIKTFTQNVVASGIEQQAGSLSLGKTGNDINSNGTFKPAVDNYRDLGTSSYKWKNLYLSGKIKDGTNEISVADILNGIVNVINASDIVDNTLTQAQYDLITNGKPTVILGTFFTSFENPLFLAPKSDGTYYNGFILGMFGNNPTTRAYAINISTKVISLYLINKISLNNIREFNDKILPNYPTANTSPQVLSIAASGGALSWVDNWKAASLVYSGAFNAQGQVYIDAGDLSDGLYLVTYSDITAFIIIKRTISGSKIYRASMPCMYGSSGETVPGNLRIDIPDQAEFATMTVSDGVHTVRSGLTVYVYKTNIM